MESKRSRHSRRVDSIKRVVAAYPDAPADLDEYEWVSAPRYWDSVAVPRGGRILPLHEDRHAGVSFKVGWSVRDRVAALWIL